MAALEHFPLLMLSIKYPTFPKKIPTELNPKGNFTISVVGTDATMEIARQNPMGYILTVSKSNAVIEKHIEMEFSGVHGELAQFIASIQSFKKANPFDASKL